MNPDTSSAILKNELHRLVVQTDNVSVLERVKEIFDLLLADNQSIDWWDKLTETEKLLVHRGLQQLENGERLPNSQIRREINQMLGKA